MYIPIMKVAFSHQGLDELKIVNRELNFKIEVEKKSVEKVLCNQVLLLLFNQQKVIRSFDDWNFRMWENTEQNKTPYWDIFHSGG